MNSVPYDFIERTILLARPPKMVKPSPFASFSGHWGRYAKLLDDQTEYFTLFVNVNRFPTLHCTVRQGEKGIRMEDALQKKHTSLLWACVFISPHIQPKAEKLDNRKKEILQKFIRRSNGRTHVKLYGCPKEAHVLTDLLAAIPRVRSILLDPDVEDAFAVASFIEKHAQQKCLHSLDFDGLFVAAMVSPKDAPSLTDLLAAIPRVVIIRLRADVEDVSAVLSFVEKHAQQKCIHNLDFNGDIPRTMFPVVRAFLKESEFLYIRVSFPSHEKVFAREISRLVALNLKKRSSRLRKVEMFGSLFMLAILKKEIGNATLDMKQEPCGEDIWDNLWSTIKCLDPCFVQVLTLSKQSNP
uniref:FBD domain-containing protein n=1 Tax=Steinernema glaseri TaxID=37863 RepID=A0A1I7YK71_9BILA